MPVSSKTIVSIMKSKHFIFAFFAFSTLLLVHFIEVAKYEELSVVKILQLLSIRNPTVIFSNGNNSEMKFKKNIARLLMDKQQFVAFSDSSKQSMYKNCDFATILTEADYKTPHLLKNILASQPYLSKNVVFVNDSKSFITPSIRLDQEVYFIHTNDWTWHEKYSINNVDISRQLGRFQRTNNSFLNNDLILIPESNFKPFIARRSNFHGIQLIAMTMDIEPYVKLADDVKFTSKYHSENDTFDVTGRPAAGSFIQMADTLELILNYSTTR
jgi:hypothetical protein